MFENHAKHLETCNACPSLCQSACPIHVETSNKTYAPWGLMQLLNRVRLGESEFDTDIASASYRCATCKACTAVCEHEVPIASILSDARKTAVKEGKAPQEIAGFIEKFHRHNNPFSKDLLARLKGLVPKNILESDSPIVYYATCTTIAKAPEIVQDTFSLFKKLGIDFVGLHADPIQCCGHPLYTAGARYEFVDIAEINYHALRSKKLIITGSPACAYTLREIYKRFDFDLSDKIVTINEFLKPYLKNVNFRVKKNIKSKMLYHDPCYLSRWLGEAELPREMISAVTGVPPEEFQENREHSHCSGQGGCFSIVDKDAADGITHKRLEEAHERKIKTVVTQCPTCVFKMRAAGEGISVHDVISYLNEVIQGSVDE